MCQVSLDFPASKRIHAKQDKSGKRNDRHRDRQQEGAVIHSERGCRHEQLEQRIVV